jgi:hypothetical protein
MRNVITALILAILLTAFTSSISANTITNYIISKPDSPKIIYAGTQFYTKCTGFGFGSDNDGTWSSIECKNMCMDFIKYDNGEFKIFKPRECEDGETIQNKLEFF